MSDHSPAPDDSHARITELARRLAAAGARHAATAEASGDFPSRALMAYGESPGHTRRAIRSRTNETDCRDAWQAPDSANRYARNRGPDCRAAASIAATDRRGRGETG